MAKINTGKQFENDFKSSVPIHVFIYRFKDATGSWQTGVCEKCKTPIQSNVRFQSSNICDFMLFNYPNLYFLELKSTKSKSLPFSALRENQKKELTTSGRRKGIRSGLVVNFRDINETYYMSIDMFNDLEEKLTSKSIPVKVFREYAVRIYQEKKQVHFTYNINRFLNEIENVNTNLF